MITPVGIEQIVKTFGSAGNEHCTQGSVHLIPDGQVIYDPQGRETSKHFHCHILLDPILDSIFGELTNEKDNYGFYSFGGCYSFRKKRGSENLSTHSWGIAMDLNCAFNPFNTSWQELVKRYAQHTKFVFTPEHPIVKLFKANGFVWGGDFNGRKDGMHFQFCGKY